MTIEPWLIRKKLDKQIAQRLNLKVIVIFVGGSIYMEETHRGGYRQRRHRR